MKIKTSDKLESSGYRCLFEYAKQYGLEQIMHFIQDIDQIDFNEKVMLDQAILYGKNSLLSLIKRNSDIVKYLREHESDLRAFSLASKNVLNTLTILSKNISLLELYLSNAKKLEELKISKVNFSFKDGLYACEIGRNSQDRIMYIKKYYTDGKIESLKPEHEIRKTSEFSFNKILFLINKDDGSPSFVLDTINNELGYQYREISITDFGFDGSKLPTEEEVRSYEIPKSLIKK